MQCALHCILKVIVCKILSHTHTLRTTYSARAGMYKQKYTNKFLQKVFLVAFRTFLLSN